MKIIKYKYIPTSKYKIFFENTTIILYEDIIIKYNILIKKELTEKELSLYLKENELYDLYYKAISYIKIRLRSNKEIEKYLKKYNDDHKIISKVIEMLNNNNFIDEDLYASSYINDAMNLKNIGPSKIIKDLEELGIKDDIIYDKIASYTKDIQYAKINKYINRELKQNKNSMYEFTHKIVNNLISKGFYKETITDCLKDVSFDDTSLKEIEYNKLYKKLSLKYSGKELEYKIKQKLYAKGFRE